MSLLNCTNVQLYYNAIKYMVYAYNQTIYIQLYNIIILGTKYRSTFSSSLMKITWKLELVSFFKCYQLNWNLIIEYVTIKTRDCSLHQFYYKSLI